MYKSAKAPTLQRFIADASVSMKDRMALAVSIALTVADAHAADACYCDIRPHNFAYDEAASEWKLWDSPDADKEWCAPEVLAGGEPNTKPADVWSLGLVIYAMLACKSSPWEGQYTPPAKVDLFGEWYEQNVLFMGTRPILANLSKPFQLGGAAAPVSTLLHACWLENPALRPSASDVAARLQGAFSVLESPLPLPERPVAPEPPLHVLPYTMLPATSSVRPLATGLTFNPDAAARFAQLAHEQQHLERELAGPLRAHLAALQALSAGEEALVWTPPACKEPPPVPRAHAPRAAVVSANAVSVSAGSAGSASSTVSAYEPLAGGSADLRVYEPLAGGGAGSVEAPSGLAAIGSGLFRLGTRAVNMFLGTAGVAVATPQPTPAQSSAKPAARGYSTKTAASNLPVVEATSLDLAFLMDCTYSMEDSIALCKDKVVEIVKTVKAKFTTASVRVAFVGYRDFDDKKKDGQLDYPVHPFTPEPLELSKFLATVEARGGADIAEDLAGGLKLLHALEWKDGARLAVLFTDAPAHGEYYHNNCVSDSHAKIKPEKYMDILVEDLARRQIDFQMFRLSEATKIMEERLAAAYNDTQVARNVFHCHENLDGNPAELIDRLVKACSKSITTARRSTAKQLGQP